MDAERQKEIANGREQEDIFWTSTGNQWTVFSKHLYDNGFYDDMTDSALFEEKIGRQVTEEHKFTMILTKVKHNQEQKNQFRQDVAGVFNLLQKGTEPADSILSRLEEIYTDYATDHNEDMPLRNYVLDQTKGTFGRMRDYWNRLLGAA